MGFAHSIGDMEIIAAVSILFVSFAVIASIVLMAMIFSVVMAQMMYGLFE